MEIRKIAVIHNDYTDKFGIPRQSGIASGVESRIVFEKPYGTADALRGIEAFSHLWLIWEFSETPKGESFQATVRPPRLGGNTRVGVWATRSPFRPNSLGLTVVRLLRVEETADGPELIVSGADLMNGTPIYDIKPYVPYADSVPDAVGGFADEHASYRLSVTIPDSVNAEARTIGKDDRWLRTLSEVLAADPRPAYQDDPQRRYGMRYGDCEVAFSVDGETLTVLEIRSASVK